MKTNKRKRSARQRITRAGWKWDNELQQGPTWKGGRYGKSWSRRLKEIREDVAEKNQPIPRQPIRRRPRGDDEAPTE